MALVVLTTLTLVALNLLDRPMRVMVSPVAKPLPVNVALTAAPTATVAGDSETTPTGTTAGEDPDGNPGA